MGSKWLTVAIVAMLSGGCASQSEPPEAAPSVRTVNKPAAGSAEESAETEAGTRQTDSFGLPLVITLEAPEVPPEIRGPSSPIKAEPASR